MLIALSACNKEAMDRQLLRQQQQLSLLPPPGLSLADILS